MKSKFHLFFFSSKGVYDDYYSNILVKPNSSLHNKHKEQYILLQEGVFTEEVQNIYGYVTISDENQTFEGPLERMPTIGSYFYRYCMGLLTREQMNGSFHLC